MVFPDEDACKEDRCGDEACEQWQNDEETKDDDFWHAEDGKILEADDPLALKLSESLEGLKDQERLLAVAEVLEYLSSVVALSGPAGMAVGFVMSMAAVGLRADAGRYSDGVSWGEAVGIAAGVGGIAGGFGILKGVRQAAEEGSRVLDVALDGTGKVHGKLPGVKDLGQYSADDLVRLRDELKQSVQKRISDIAEMGTNFGHSERLAAEQQLIKSIEKHLGNR